MGVPFCVLNVREEPEGVVIALVEEMEDRPGVSVRWRDKSLNCWCWEA